MHILTEALPDMWTLNFRSRSQRQVRKRHRAAAANGNRNAFTGPIKSAQRSRSKYRPHVGAKQKAKKASSYTFA